MYKRIAQGWSKHLDFIILDEIVLVLSFMLGMYIWHGSLLLQSSAYRTLLFVLILADLISIIFLNAMHDVLKRGYGKEFSSTFKLCLTVFLIATAFMFSTQSGDTYSRLTLYYTAILHLILGYTTRIGYKAILQKKGKVIGIGAKKRSMLALLRAENAEEMAKRLLETPAEAYTLKGIVLDGPTEKTEIYGIPVVSDLAGCSSYICREWIDSVYIDIPSENEAIQKLMADCREMAVPVHYHIPGVSRYQQKQFVERIGGSTVLTLSTTYATPTQLFLKRVMDLIGGFFGSIIALLIMAIVGPIIKYKSPGPILYKSERIGQNGRHFLVTKFSSMRNDLVIA